MEQAETVTLAFAPEGHGLAARLDVRCRDERDAADLASQFTRTTSLLRETMEREHRKPNPADLSGVLTAGAFRNEGRRVLRILAHRAGLRPERPGRKLLSKRIVHVDLGQYLHRLAGEEGRLINPLSHGVHGGLDRQRVAFHRLKIMVMAVV